MNFALDGLEMPCGFIAVDAKKNNCE